MFVKVLRRALLALALGASCAFAQSASDVGGPRELPPPGFAGQQYVDSRGCVFLRAGIGGQVNWVPRVDRNRRAMCGYPPSVGGGTAMAAAPAPKPVAPRVRAAEPPPESYTPAPVAGLRPVAVTPRPAAVAPVVAPVAVPVVPVAPRVAGTGRQIGCTTSAPVPARLKLTSGGTVVVCTRGDGTLEGLRAPIYPQGAGVGASLSDGGQRLVPLGQPSAVGSGVAGARVADAGPSVPKGFKPAWKDDRLNPLRGVGTAEGQAAQDRILTRQVPARPLDEAGPLYRLTVASKTAPASVAKPEPAAEAAQPAVAGRFFVQVGSFAQAANAEGAAGRLAALGLPVARSEGRIGGKPVQVILAGPFGDSGAAQAALRAARGAGFGDAFVR